MAESTPQKYAPFSCNDTAFKMTTACWGEYIWAGRWLSLTAVAEPEIVRYLKKKNLYVVQKKYLSLFPLAPKKATMFLLTTTP